jgi:queuine tRNA-ribosyltransferase
MMAEIRQAIADNRFMAYKQAFLADYLASEKQTQGSKKHSK